jgi:hypothetical protein
VYGTSRKRAERREVVQRVLALERQRVRMARTGLLENDPEQDRPPLDLAIVARGKVVDLLRCQVAIGGREVKVEFSCTATPGEQVRRAVTDYSCRENGECPSPASCRPSWKLPRILVMPTASTAYRRAAWNFSQRIIPAWLKVRELIGTVCGWREGRNESFGIAGGDDPVGLYKIG